MLDIMFAYQTYDNMMPLSTENESVGSPEMFHCRIFTGSPRVAIREKSSEHGIPFSFTLAIHISAWSCENRENFLSETRNPASLFIALTRKYWYFSYFAMKICHGYSLKVPQWGTSNEYPQHMFLWRNKKNNIRIIRCYESSYLFYSSMKMYIERIRAVTEQLSSPKSHFANKMKQEFHGSQCHICIGQSHMSIIQKEVSNILQTLGHTDS